MNNRLIIFIAFLLVCFLSTDVLAQCAMCKSTVQSNLDKNPGAIGAGINKGILYLLAMPYIFLTTIAIIYRKQLMEKWRKYFPKKAS